jgi:hypothetical protein
LALGEHQAGRQEILDVRGPGRPVFGLGAERSVAVIADHGALECLHPNENP